MVRGWPKHTLSQRQFFIHIDFRLRALRLEKDIEADVDEEDTLSV